MQQNANRATGASSDGSLDREPGGSVRCPRCEADSPPARKFCSNCGASLWDACFQCGEQVGASEKFCGACGVDLAASLHERTAGLQRDLLEAQRLELDCCYEQAIAVLEPITRAGHSRLVGYARQAKELIGHLRAACRRGRADADAAFQEARACLASLDYETAVQTLEDVPPPLRTEAMRAELAATRQKLDQIDTLSGQLRAAVAGKQGAGLLAKVNRLLELKPNHPQALALARQLRDRLCRTAAGRLARHQYDEAVDLLDRVPEAVQTPETARLRERAVELAWLRWDLRTAPFVDKTLLSAAGRLRKLAPGDPKVEKLLEPLRRRVRRAEEASGPRPVAWAAPPRRTLLGPPVDWTAGFRRIEIGREADVSVLKAHPGCFFTACGLALQGLGKARLAINLQPADKGRFLGLARRAMRKQPAAAAWGIDVSSGGLKAVKLAVSARQCGVTLEACYLIEHRKILSQAVNRAEQRELVEESIRKFRARHELKEDRVCLGLPGMMAFCRQLRLPPMDAKRIPEVMQYEVRHHFPHERGDLVWGYHVMKTAEDEAPGATGRDVLLVAAGREPLSRHLENVQGLACAFDVIQCDPLALHNLVAYEHFDGGGQKPQEPRESNTAIGVLDAGTDGTNFVISSPGGAWFRNIGVGGHRFTKALMRRLNVTFAQAEQLKRDPAQAERMSPIHEALEPIFKDLVHETLASLGAHDAAHGKKRIERFLATGGSFRMHGLLRFLRTGR